jgi:hypothetical protein
MCVYYEQPPQKVYKRFCKATVVYESEEGPYLGICGVGYQNRHRKIYKNVDLCKRHLLILRKGV